MFSILTKENLMRKKKENTSEMLNLFPSDEPRNIGKREVKHIGENALSNFYISKAPVGIVSNLEARKLGTVQMNAKVVEDGTSILIDWDDVHYILAYTNTLDCITDPTKVKFIDRRSASPKDGHYKLQFGKYSPSSIRDRGIALECAEKIATNPEINAQFPGIFYIAVYRMYRYKSLEELYPKCTLKRLKKSDDWKTIFADTNFEQYGTYIQQFVAVREALKQKGVVFKESEEFKMIRHNLNVLLGNEEAKEIVPTAKREVHQKALISKKRNVKYGEGTRTRKHRDEEKSRNRWKIEQEVCRIYTNDTFPIDFNDLDLKFENADGIMIVYQNGVTKSNLNKYGSLNIICPTKESVVCKDSISIYKNIRTAIRSLNNGWERNELSKKLSNYEDKGSCFLIYTANKIQDN